VFLLSIKAGGTGLNLTAAAERFRVVAKTALRCMPEVMQRGDNTGKSREQ
jgi:hypothetical protein